MDQTLANTANNCCYSLKDSNQKIKDIEKVESKDFYISAPTPFPNKELQEKVERLIPYSEAKVYRTKNGFVVRDNNDDQWCKFVPFDDLDRVATKVACRTLEPARIEAMELMPLPSFVSVPKEALQEYETELEHSSIQDREVARQAPATVHIESLRMTEEPTFEDELTSGDLIKNQFGSLAPYIEDYFNDQYDIEG